MKRLEAIVGFLIPPSCRESVAGDLRERNLSDGDYIIEAAATIPLVVWSRIRRTTDPRVLLLEGLVCMRVSCSSPGAPGTFFYRSGPSSGSPCL